MHTGFCWEELREGDHLEGLGVDGRIMLKWVFVVVGRGDMVLGWLVGWLVGGWVGWLVGCLAGCYFYVWLVGWLVGWFVGWVFVGWLVGWLVWSVGVVGWLAG